MQIEREKYLKYFVDEGLDIIKSIENKILNINSEILSEDDLSAILRLLHTMKGSARMLEFKRVEDISHSLESVFTAFKEKRIKISEDAVKLILIVIDLLKTIFNSIEEKNDDDFDIDEYVTNLSLLASGGYFSLSCVNDEEINSSGQIKDSKRESIRLPIEKIDSIIKNIAALQSLEMQSKNILQNSVTLNNLIKSFSKAIKLNEKTNAFLLTELENIEHTSSRLCSFLKDFSANTGNNIKEMYDSVISLRTLPVSNIFVSYPRYVYQLSGELGKKVNLVIEGQENEIDKNIIESMSEIILHMVRNSIDHGIEPPDERIAMGKSDTGKLSIICSRESGSMKIIISDDGRGIDHDAIREKALRDGYILQEEAAQLSNEDITNFIFQSGFSTSQTVSNVSGRGIGLDIVRDNIESLKGSIIVESVKGEGTAFTITVPLSIAAFTGFPVECAGMKFIIPAGFTDNIMLADKKDIITSSEKQEIKYNDKIIRLYYLSRILQLKEDLLSPKDKIFIVIIRSYEDTAALAVDNIGNMRALILKTMPDFMRQLNVFSGIILNEDYEMISVLHIPTIIKIAKNYKTIENKKRGVKPDKKRKSILVVDDSLPVREIECEILQSEGYSADTASNGVQALNAIKLKNYDLICTDINMPEMDGYALIENIKKSVEHASVPIIVISSISVEEEKTKVLSLGASRYIIKNSSNNQNLLETVNELIGGAFDS